jgi:putative membrane protein
MGKVKQTRERSIWKGALAGLVGGIVGSGAKTLAEKASSPRDADSAIAVEPQTQLEVTAKSWVVGAVAGAAYGAAIEIEPKAGVWGGAGFGLALRKIVPEPLSPEGEARTGAMTIRQVTRQRQSEWISYAVFGVVTEAVRRLVRKGL